MTLAEDATALQARISEAQRARARAEGARDAAQDALARAKDELKADYGVDTVEAAETLLADLREELAGLTEEISAKLDEIGV